MKRRDLVLTVIWLGSNSPDFGRTSLQKVTYLVAEAFGFELGHHAHFYGPFSPVVENDVEALLMAKLIEEKKRTIGISSSGVEIPKYEYDLTPEGEARISALQSHYGDLILEIGAFLNALETSAGSLHQRVLAPTAKVHFIEHREGRNLEPSDVSQVAHNLGWQVHAGEVEKVREILESLDNQRDSLHHRNLSFKIGTIVTATVTHHLVSQSHDVEDQHS